MPLSNDLLVDLGCPIVRKRLEAVERYLEAVEPSNEDLLNLAWTNNVFLVISLCEISCRVGRAQLVPCLMSHWYVQGAPGLASIPWPNENDRWWKASAVSNKVIQDH